MILSVVIAGKMPYWRGKTSFEPSCFGTKSPFYWLKLKFAWQ